jgi:hypothetical protein
MQASSQHRAPKKEEQQKVQAWDTQEQPTLTQPAEYPAWGRLGRQPQPSALKKTKKLLLLGGRAQQSLIPKTAGLPLGAAGQTGTGRRSKEKHAPHLHCLTQYWDLSVHDQRGPLLVPQECAGMCWNVHIRREVSGAPGGWRLSSVSNEGLPCSSQG